MVETCFVKKLLRICLVLLAALIFPASGSGQHVDSASAQEERNLSQRLAEGERLLHSRKVEESLDYFDKVALAYEEKFSGNSTKYYSARTPNEGMMYMVEAASTKAGAAKVVSSNWAQAFFLKAYALVEMRRLDEAKAALERALALSPRNSNYLSELAAIYLHKKDWASALQAYQLAEAAAKDFSPPNLKDSELARAWRGKGYVYVEQNRLDDAEKMYQQCLELNKNDIKAINELRYIQKMKSKAAGTQ
ncbi:MAG: tetratricopeptide repeat protein [Burkholderiales bacterium]|nr:tetratricopeptide repeat protein [Burkholderiales bacterium]